jgi:hypothetical protein
VKIHRAYIISTIVGITIVVITAFYLLNLSIISKAKNRERHFISIYYLAKEYVLDRGSDEPASFESLVRDYGGTDGALAQPFSNGLKYNLHGTKFILEEPQQEHVSLFRKDRLVATELNRPYWERTGKQAKKRNEEAEPQR